MAKTYVAGVVTAYGAAVEAGYTGTYEEFCEEQAKFAENAQQVAEDRAAVDAAAEEFTGTTVPSAVQEVETAGAAQVDAVEAEGETQRGLIQEAASGAIGNVETAGAAQVEAVQAEGTTQVGNVNTAGTTQVGNVNTAGATQVAEVQAKGTEVINSIPADYTELTQEVSDLNQQITQFIDSSYDGYFYNPANIFQDVTLSKASGLSTGSVTVGMPSGQIYYSAVDDLSTEFVSIPLGSLFQTKPTEETYYFHFNIRALRNTNFAYKNPTLAVNLYGNNSLKGSKILWFDTPNVDPTVNTFKEYVLEYIIPANSAAFDELHLSIRQGFDIYIKDFYITHETDSTPLYKNVVFDGDLEEYVEANTLSEDDVVDLIEEYAPIGTNGLKLAIIGDSLSAYSSGYTKYHDLLQTNNHYVVTNCAVSGSSYMNGSLQGGTRDHHFYNQALRIPNDTEAVLVFGSFNDIALLNGRYYIYNANDEYIGEGQAGEAPSSSATLLTTDSSDAHSATHNAVSALAAGTYRMVFNGNTYQFATNIECPTGGKIILRVCTLGEIGTDESDIYTLVGSFSTMLTNLYTKNNGMLIGIVTPTPWILYNSVSPYSASALTSCTNYVNKLKELANHYMLPFLNLYDESNLRPWDSDFRTTYYNSADGVHPNDLGHATFLYPHMREFLRTYNPKNI